MRLGDGGSRQYAIVQRREDKKDSCPYLTFFSSKEEWDDLKDDADDEIIFEGYVDIDDIEIYDHEDFESFIKEECKTPWE